MGRRYPKMILALVLTTLLPSSRLVASPSIAMETDTGFEANFGPASALESSRYTAEWEAKGTFFADMLTARAGQDIEFEGVELDSTDAMRGRVDGLPGGELRNALLGGLRAIAELVDSIGQLATPIEISELESRLSAIRSIWDNEFIAPLQAHASLPVTVRGGLLHRAGELRRHYDDLRYVAGRFRLYGRSDFQGAARLRDAALAIANGRRNRAAAVLVRLLDLLDNERGKGIQEDAADRARSRLDRMLRRLRTIGTTFHWTSSFETTFAGLELEASGFLSSSHYQAPSANVRSYGIGLAAESAWEGWEVVGSYAWQDRTYADRMQANLDRIRQDLSFSVAWGADQFDTAFRPSWQLDLHPRRIDPELEPARADEVRGALWSLRDRVTAAELPDDLAAGLLEALQEALDRLASKEFAGVVDALEDFIDAARSGRWDGELDRPTADVWIAEAERLLPRRRRLKTKLPFTGTFDLDNTEVRINAEQETDHYPAHPTLDRMVRITELRVIRWIGSLKITSELARRTTDYPPRPHLSSDRWSGSLDVATHAGPLETSVSWFDQLTTYLEPAKDCQIRKQSLALGAPFLSADVTLSYDTDRTSYPNDPGRAPSGGTDTQIGAKWDLSDGRLSLALRVQEDLDNAGTVERTTRDLAISWSTTTLDGLKLDMSLDWRDQTHLQSPEDDTHRLRIHLSGTWSF